MAKLEDLGTKRPDQDENDTYSYVLLNQTWKYSSWTSGGLFSWLSKFFSAVGGDAEPQTSEGPSRPTLSKQKVVADQRSGAMYSRLVYSISSFRCVNSDGFLQL